ncbi:MAG: hypothetical protein QXT73_08620 [Candidatus Methanomethylicaceae archaeon]
MSHHSLRVQKKIQALSQMLEQLKNPDLELESILRSYSDGELYLRILGIRGEWNTQDEIALESRIQGTMHHRDRRNARDYISDLILGWVIQDVIAKLLEYEGISTEHKGADSARQLLTGTQTTEEPDLLIIPPSGRRIWVDVVSDYPDPDKKRDSYWKQIGQCDLRDNKYRRLLSVSTKGYEPGLLGILVGSCEFFFVLLTPELEHNGVIKHIPSHPPFGGKPAVALRLRQMNVEFAPLTSLPEFIRSF